MFFDLHPSWAKCLGAVYSVVVVVVVVIVVVVVVVVVVVLIVLGREVNR